MICSRHAVPHPGCPICMDQGVNIRPDRAHAGKPEHIDMTTILPEIGGADKVEIDKQGNVIGGSTHVGKAKMPW